MKKFLTIIFLLFTTVCFAQNTNLIFEYDSFEGGLNTRMSEFALPKSQATISENIRYDTEFKSLTKRDKTVVACTTNADSNPVLGLSRFYMKDSSKVTVAMYDNDIVTCDDATGVATNILTVATADQRWDCETWHDILICTDGSNAMVKYDGSSASATYIGTALATDKGSGAGPNGTYNYKVTCYTASYETALNTASNDVTVSNKDITLTMIPICPDSYLGESITGRKIYRSDAGGGGTYNLVPNTGTIADNTTVTIDDTEDDAAVDAEAAYPSTYNDTPPKGRFGVIHKNRLWVANNSTAPSRIYYSEDGLHDFFLSDSYFNIRPNDGDEITFVENLLGLLTVSKNNTIQKIDTRGDDPDADWAITDPFSFIGCQAPYSAVNADTGIMYLGNNGIYNFTGQYSELISDAITPTIRDIQQSNFPNVWAAYYKNSYYMAYPSLASGSASNNRLLVVDLIDKAFNIDLFSVNILHVFDSGSDVEALYSGSSGNGKIFGHTETVKEIIHKKHSDFGGTFNDARYIPVSVGGDADNAEIEIAWTTDIDTITSKWYGTIDGMATSDSIIDRPDTTGVYTSDTITINATSLDKIYWNETLPPGGGSVSFDIRSGSTAGGITAAPWTTGISDSSGTDISGTTADTVFQYRINMTTDTITQTPTIVSDGSYAVRITYNIGGTTDETTIPIRWRSGWLDFGAPGRVKELKKIYVYYDWPANTAGTLNLKFTGMGAGTYSASQTETDSFAIDLISYPDFYVERFPGGNMIGELIRLDITETSLNPITIKKIIVVYDVQEQII